jgi:hypothetical protein
VDVGYEMPDLQAAMAPIGRGASERHAKMVYIRPSNDIREPAMPGVALILGQGSLAVQKIAIVRSASEGHPGNSGLTSSCLKSAFGDWKVHVRLLHW